MALPRGSWDGTAKVLLLPDRPVGALARVLTAFSRDLRQQVVLPSPAMPQDRALRPLARRRAVPSRPMRVSILTGDGAAFARQQAARGAPALALRAGRVWRGWASRPCSPAAACCNRLRRSSSSFRPVGCSPPRIAGLSVRSCRPPSPFRPAAVVLKERGPCPGPSTNVRPLRRGDGPGDCRIGGGAAALGAALDSAACACTMPANGVTGRRYSGINVLIPVGQGHRGRVQFAALADLPASASGGRQCPQGASAAPPSVMHDRFTPKSKDDSARDDEQEARTIAFLKRFTVFNIDQCEGLPDALTQAPEVRPEIEILPEVAALIDASGADVRIGGHRAYYHPAADYVAVPRSRPSASRSTGTAHAPRSLAIGRGIQRAWIATRRAHSAAQLCARRAGRREWQAPLPVRRWRSKRRCGMPTMSARGSRCCGTTTRPSPSCERGQQGGADYLLGFAADEGQPS